MTLGLVLVGLGVLGIVVGTVPWPLVGYVLVIAGLGWLAQEYFS